MAEIDNRIKDLRRELRVAEETARVLCEQLHAAQIEKCGIKVGDIVTAKGKLYRVAAHSFVAGEVWLKGNPKLKSGDWSLGRTTLYGGWQKVDHG